MRTSEAQPASGTAFGATSGPQAGARMYLDGGLRYEQAGVSARAIAAYESALDSGASLAERAEAHLRLARVYRSICRWDDALGKAREAVRLATEAGDRDLTAEAMNAEVGVWQLRGEYDTAESLARSALEQATAPRVRGMLLQNLGAIAAQRRQFAAAERLFSASVQAFEAADYTLGIAIALNNASAAARDGGDAARALELARRADAVARQADALDVVILAIQNEAHALVDLGQLDRAEALLGEALGHFAATHNDLRQAECLEIMGRIQELRGDHRETARRCYERARDLGRTVGDAVLLERIGDRLTRLG